MDKGVLSHAWAKIPNVNVTKKSGINMILPSFAIILKFSQF